MYRCFRSGSILLCLACSVLTVAPSVNAQELDLNGNGMSDVWDYSFGNGPISPDLDSDGDGVINSLEAIAGTDPFNTNSFPRILMVARSGTDVTVGMESALGKNYELQSIPLIGAGSNWITETSTIARTGTVVTLIGEASADVRFYRIAITDVDTDGDGLNDWEEYKLGL